MNIWTILTVAALVLLVVYWRARNAVWGGMTLGIIVGVLCKVFGRTGWNIVIRVAVVGALVGFGTELPGLISRRLRYKVQPRQEDDDR